MTLWQKKKLCAGKGLVTFHNGKKWTNWSFVADKAFVNANMVSSLALLSVSLLRSYTHAHTHTNTHTGYGLLGAKTEEQRQTLASVRSKGRMNPLDQKGYRPC